MSSPQLNTTATVGHPGGSAARPPLAPSQKVGLWILLVITVLSGIPFAPGADGGAQVGPPVAVVVLDAVLGVAILALCIVALVRRSRVAIRVACGLAILDALTAVPAFFADQPAAIVASAALYVVLTAVAVALALRARRP